MAEPVAAFDAVNDLRRRLVTPDAWLAPAVSASTATFTAADLMAKVFPEPRWAVDGVIPEGATLLVGAPKKGKSWLVLAMGAAIAAGGVTLGKIPVAGGDVLYLALEDTERRLQERLRILLDGEPAPDRLHIATRWPSLDDGAALHLDLWLGRHPDARLVVIDTLARLRSDKPANGSLYQADYATMVAFKTVADAHGVALVVVHHTRKADAEDPLDLVSGTTGIAGAADTILVLRRETSRADATLYVRGRDVPEADHALAFDAVTCRWNLLGDAAEYRLSEERVAVLRVLADAGEALSPKQVAEALGKKEGAIRLMLRRMDQAGEVLGKSGRYTPAASAPVVTPVTPPVTPSAPVSRLWEEDADQELPELQVLQGESGNPECGYCGAPLPPGRNYLCRLCQPDDSE